MISAPARSKTSMASCCPAAAKAIRKTSGTGDIVNVTSVAGLNATGSSIPYAASKAALNNVTLSLARTLAPDIRVNAVAPGFIDTEMTRVLDETVRQQLIEQIPLSRLGVPEDVARCVYFLVSDKSSYITGQVINLNGGMLM